jgi:hypothetical protein
VYDLAAYAFNPVYSDKWYRPLAVNPLTIAPVLLSVLGVIGLVRRSRGGRVFVLTGMITGALVLVGAFAQRYPLGGVRQCLPLTVFAYVWLGAGVETLYRWSRPAVLILAAGWAVVWLTYLPQFYGKRLSPFNVEELLHQVQAAGGAPLVAANPWGCPEDQVFAYHLREHPEVSVSVLCDSLDRLRERRMPFLLAATSRDLHRLRTLAENEPEAKQHAALLALVSDPDASITPVLERSLNPVQPSRIQDGMQSIYTPLNGLFLYRVDWMDAPVHREVQGQTRASPRMGSRS